MSVLVVGELNPDLILQNARSFPTPGTETVVENMSLALGSASAICAGGLAKLGQRVGFIAKVGDDDWGRFCKHQLTLLGVDISGVQTDTGLQTGLTVSITTAHDRALVTYLGAMVAVRQEDIKDDVLRSYAHLHVSSFFLQKGLRPGLKKLFERATDLGLTTSLDPGFDPEEAWGDDLRDVLQQVDVFLPNEVELAGVTGLRDRTEALRALQNGRTVVVAKLGAEGSMTLQDGRPVLIPGFPVRAIDTTGAGDSFNAGFLYSWLQKEPVTEAMRFASACGALSTTALGGTAGQPTAEAARAFLRSAMKTV
jgi:sugar/nucleoside kinase (ribokinase family)